MVEQAKVVANVCADGDPSVGMQPWFLKITIEGMELAKEPEDRKYLREDLTRLFTEHLEWGRIAVTFSDECPDCSRIGCKGECQLH